MTERSRDRGFDHAVMVGNLSDLTTEQRGQYQIPPDYVVTS
jgi:hypothetical protein